MTPSRLLVERMLRQMRSDRNYTPYHYRRIIRTATEALIRIEQGHTSDGDTDPEAIASEALDRIGHMQRFR